MEKLLGTLEGCELWRLPERREYIANSTNSQLRFPSLMQDKRWMEKGFEIIGTDGDGRLIAKRIS
jgi:hypothetical protein